MEEEAKQIEKPMPAVLPLREATSKPDVDPSSSEHDADTSEPSLACPWSEEQLDMIQQTTDQEEQSDSEEMAFEQTFAEFAKLQARLHELVTDSPGYHHDNATSNQIEKKVEDAVSMAKSQPDIGKEEQKPQRQLDESEKQQPPQDDGCPECRIKMARINDLEMELRNQEEKARQHENAAIWHERDLAETYTLDIRKELSNRINELEAQQSGQISTSESATSQPRPAYYYCEECRCVQMELHKAKQQIRDSEYEARHRDRKIRVLDYQFKDAQEEGRVLRQDLNEANREISRLRAELGRRTSKL